MFKTIKINDFRVLKNITLDLGQYITVFSGWNATGKSTLLALLANSSELKVKDGRTYSGEQFRAEFSEIIKGSLDYDKSEQNKLEIDVLLDGQIKKKYFRTAWQENNTRFRVIPLEKGSDGKKLNEAKFSLPVLYLGLSRLYPVGEFEDENLVSNEQSFSTEDNKWFIEKYNHVLSKHEDITSITNIDVKLAKKEKMGINTTTYDWRTNSAGQDNVSQILRAVLSFKKLKREQGNKFKGGLLVIDELEASLHPKAQEKIFEDILLKEAKNIGFQVIFTTHSLTLINNVCKKVNNNTIISYYFTHENRKLQVLKNANYDFIENDLLVKPIDASCKKPQKIVIYSEDDEARWFIKKLLYGYNSRIDLRNVKISCSSLVDLMNCEPCFKNYIVIFDGDFDQQRRIKINKDNYITLPTKQGQKLSPEKLLREFLFSDDAKEYYENEKNKYPTLKLEYFEENDVKNDNDKAERVRYKEWFNFHKRLFEQTKLFSYWKEKHLSEYNLFRSNFLKVFNKIAKKNNIELL